MSASNTLRHGLVPFALTIAVACTLGACKKDEVAAPGQQGAQAAKPAPTPESVVAATVSAMSADQLRDAASKAYNENRLYAPAGNNAMEYYLALRDKLPGDASAASALNDLLPMAVIATEQGIAREDFDEAKRLAALIGKADPNHPALGRLKASIGSNEKAVAQRADAQKLSAEEEAKRKADQAKQREEDQKKLQEQQRLQQSTAEQQRQQQAAAEAEAERLRQVAAEAERQRVAAAEAARPRPATPAQPAAAKPTASNELRAVSTPSPRFPPAAQRSGGTGTVQVEFTVGTDGSVTSARVVSSDAPRQFQRDFEREALAAVKRWRFQPVGQATTSRRTIAFE